MYCTHCGTERDDHATECRNCGRPVEMFAPAVAGTPRWMKLVTAGGVVMVLAFLAFWFFFAIDRV
jgi:hypothetical protein